MPGKITVFTAPGCSNCEQVRRFLTDAGAKEVSEINIQEKPEWTPLLCLLTGGSSVAPQVFFNATYMGSLLEIRNLVENDELGGAVRDCLDESDPTPFPPELCTPDPTEYFQLVPPRQRQEWQLCIDELCSTLSTPDKQVELVLMMMDTPTKKMVVVCSAGAASSQFKVGGAGADKKPDGTEEKLYCQMVMQERKSFFFNDPANLPSDLKNNIDLVKYGYGYYIGVPWSVGEMRGTVVALEKQGGILKEEHVPIIEQVRDKIEKDWKEFLFL